MRDNNKNFTTSISLNGAEFNDVSIKDSNFTNKNICIIKSDLTNIPTASADYLNSCFLYIGANTDTYKNNTIYNCIKNGEAYSWSEVIKIGGESIKVVTALPEASKDNLGSVYLLDNTIYKCQLVNEKYVNNIIGYINSFTTDTTNLLSNTLYYTEGGGFQYYNGTKLVSILDKSKLNDLADVSVESPTEGDFLVWDKDNLKWSKSSLLFDNGTVATTKVGGVSKDADLSNMSVIEVLKLMLTGSIDPANLSLADFTTTYKKGQTVDMLVVEATCKSTDVDLVKIEWYKDDTLLKETSLSGKSATAKYVYENLTEDCTIKAVLTTANGETFEATREIKFVSPSYYGIEGNLKEIMLEARGVVLVYDYGDTLVQPVYKYPASYGKLEKITDESGNDDYMSSFTQTTEMIDSIEYNVYTKKVKSYHKSFKYWFR